MVYTRFTKYSAVLKMNKRSAIRTLYSISAGDTRTSTGANTRRILLDTKLDPRSTHARELESWRVYPAADAWTVPLLTSLLQLRSDSWVVNFDLEEEECLEDDDIGLMIDAVCIG